MAFLVTDCTGQGCIFKGDHVIAIIANRYRWLLVERAFMEIVGGANREAMVEVSFSEKKAGAAHCAIVSRSVILCWKFGNQEFVNLALYPNNAGLVGTACHVWSIPNQKYYKALYQGESDSEGIHDVSINKKMYSLPCNLIWTIVNQERVEGQHE